MSLSKSDLEFVRQLIESAESFAITVHVRPDADSIGSALALARGLRLLGKHAIVISSDGVPETCAYLPDAETVLKNTDERGFDIGVICDADGLGRWRRGNYRIFKSLLCWISSSERRLNVENTAHRHKSIATAEIVFQLLLS